MNYRLRQKERKIKNILYKIFNTFSFKSRHLSFGGKIVLFGTVSLFVSLFFPWVLDKSKLISWNAFSTINGNIGYIILSITFILSFLILSNNNKEKLKLHTKISFQNYLLIILFGIFVLVTSFMAISYINGLQTFAENIIHGKGAIIALSSGILITFGGYILRKEHHNSNLGVFVNHDDNSISKIEQKNNMKLPF